MMWPSVMLCDSQRILSMHVCVDIIMDPSGRMIVIGLITDLILMACAPLTRKFCHSNIKNGLLCWCCICCLCGHVCSVLGSVTDVAAVGCDHCGNIIIIWELIICSQGNILIKSRGGVSMLIVTNLSIELYVAHITILTVNQNPCMDDGGDTSYPSLQHLCGHMVFVCHCETSQPQLKHIFQSLNHLYVFRDC